MIAMLAATSPKDHPPVYSRLEIAAVLHVGTLVVFASWVFGGNIGWARPALSLFGGVGGIAILLGAAFSRLSGSRSLRAFHFLWPLLGYDILVLLSTLQPAFTTGVIYDARVLVPVSALTAWPCSAQPAETIRALLLFNALVLPAFNLLLCVRTRRTLRTLLLVLAGNALALAVFGSLQKLVGASGLFFGAVASPNKTFFASFIYHNHWGAFLVLMLAAEIGLVFHYAVRSGPRDFWHSPAFIGLVGALILATTAPLSTSRSATVLVTFLLGAALVDAIGRLLKSHASEGRSRIVTILALVLGAIVAAYAIFDLARPIIAERTVDTRQQVAAMHAAGSVGSRAKLYVDTWRMVKERAVFGWGLGSYPVVFLRYNTQVGSDRLPQYYVDAHSDWLQSLAETGFVGTSLLGLLVACPAIVALRKHPRQLPAYLLAGCGLVLLYAWIEFPFGCPAVTATFWLLLCSATRLAQLEEREPVRPA